MPRIPMDIKMKNNATPSDSILTPRMMKMVESRNPPPMNVLRTSVKLAPFWSQRSDSQPLNIPMHTAMMKGREERKPVLSTFMPRSMIR